MGTIQVVETSRHFTLTHLRGEKVGVEVGAAGRVTVRPWSTNDDFMFVSSDPNRITAIAELLIEAAKLGTRIKEKE